MKKIWFRVGMETTMLDDEYERLLKTYKENNYDQLVKIMNDIIATGELSGETYIVGKCNGGVDDYDNPEEEISIIY
ncbi:MAG: hypothetical protein PUE12_18580 [Oscillospiraceae bacterium]|nr:hypothetical protein [Oscillospiraceae bacterium]